MEGSKSSREEGKRRGEEHPFADSVELFEQIFKEAAPSIKSSSENIPSPPQKPSRKSAAANVPKFRRTEPQEQTFKVKLKPSKRAPTDPGEPRRIELPVRTQAEPRKKAQKRTNRRARWVALVGLAVPVILATPVFLHSLGVIKMPGVLEFLNFSREVTTPPPPPQRPLRKLPDKASPPKADKAGTVPASNAVPTPATKVSPAEAVEVAPAASPQPHSQPPSGSSAKDLAGPAEPLPSAGEGIKTTEPLALPAETKAMTSAAAIEVVPKRQEAARHPYSLYLGSFSTPEQVRKALSIHQREDPPPYAVKMDFGDKGVWYRIFMGHFQTRDAAEAFIARHRIQGAEVKETKYAVRLGTFSVPEAVEAKKNSLSTLGFFPYTIKEAGGQVSLFTGAFLRKEDAERECRDLKSKGIPAETVER